MVAVNGDRPAPLGGSATGNPDESGGFTFPVDIVEKVKFKNPSKV